jgi:mRNA-degrading endonuclease toxin of MazEF toxin-antitoxin module
MPIDKAKLISLLSAPITTPVAVNPAVRTELANVLQDTRTLVEPQPVSDVIPFILWQNQWNDIGFFGPKKNARYRKEAERKYSRGRKVFVDLGYNIGQEGAMPHPCIVLYNFIDLLIVVPTTSNTGHKISNMEPDIQKVNLVVPKDGIIFPNETIIQLHQIRVVSKNRILKDLNCNVRDYIPMNEWIDQVNVGLKAPGLIPYGTDLQKVLEMKVCFHYAPDVFHQMLRLRQQVETLEQEKRTLTHQLDELRKTYEQVAPWKE